MVYMAVSEENGPEMDFLFTDGFYIMLRREGRIYHQPFHGFLIVQNICVCHERSKDHVHNLHHIAPVLKILFTVKKNGHRAIIFQGHLHVGAEDAGSHCKALSFTFFHHQAIKFIGPVRRFGFRKTGPSSMAGIAIESELGNDGKLPFDVKKRQVQFPCFIFKNTEVENFVNYVVGILF